MDTGTRRYGEAAGPAETRTPPLDYYLIFPDPDSASAAADRAPGAASRGSGAANRGSGAGSAPGAAPDGLVVEEFVLAGDHSAAGLNSAGWAPADGRWWSSAAFSRGMRGDPRLSARVVPADRGYAELAYRRLGGGELPGETALRAHFHDYGSLADSAPLRLDTTQVPEGFDDRRVYRMLFAKELDGDRLAHLRALWRMAPTGDVADPRSRLFGTAALSLPGGVFRWDLRRIGSDVAWCLDLTADLVGGSDDVTGPLLRELRAVMRRQGLIPVTIERFS